MLVVVAIIVIAVSGALSPPPTYAVFIHVYDNSYHPQTVYDLKESMLIANVTVTVSGVDQPTRFTPTGIIAYDQLPAGTYQISVSGNATIAVPFAYAIGPNCADRTPDGKCHALVAATRTS